jgi:hypothetical protein
VPGILLAIWHKVLYHCPKWYVPRILLAIWHKVPCNDFNIFLNWSDAREQGEAAKMTYNSSALPLLLQSKIEIFKGEICPAPAPGKCSANVSAKN